MMNLNELQELALKQENDWKIVTSLQIKSLQEALVQETAKSSTLKSKFQQLKDDFKYNYQVSQPTLLVGLLKYRVYVEDVFMLRFQTCTSGSLCNVLFFIKK